MYICIYIYMYIYINISLYSYIGYSNTSGSRRLCSKYQRPFTWCTEEPGHVAKSTHRPQPATSSDGAREVSRSPISLTFLGYLSGEWETWGNMGKPPSSIGQTRLDDSDDRAEMDFAVQRQCSHLLGSMDNQCGTDRLVLGEPHREVTSTVWVPR